MIRRAHFRWCAGPGSTWRLRIIAAAVPVFMSALEAQERPPVPTIVVRGIAYDSLRQLPLSGATVLIDGARSVATDSAGRFTFEGVEPGEHLFEVTHALLDSIGVPAIVSRVRFDQQRPWVSLAVPSFGTFWRAACGDRVAPADSGFVYGTVRIAGTERAIPSASVEFGWSELRAEPNRPIEERRVSLSSAADANGEFSLCGTPADELTRVRVSMDSSYSAQLVLFPTPLRIRRRDVYLVPTLITSDTPLGSVVGELRSSQGSPVVDAQILLDDSTAGRSDATGRFRLVRVPAGTHMLGVRAVGATPRDIAIDVRPGETATIASTVDRLTTLAEVRVVASAWQIRLIRAIEARRRTGVGYMADSTALRGRGTMRAVFGGMAGVRVIPSRFRAQLALVMRTGDGDSCTPTAMVDGHPVDLDQLSALRPDEIGVMEVYTRAASIPTELQRGIPSCGLIVVWTKRALP